MGAARLVVAGPNYDHRALCRCMLLRPWHVPRGVVELSSRGRLHEVQLLDPSTVGAFGRQVDSDRLGWGS
eukprot:COSAG01_NODE_3815_length_5671_cov_2.363604_4_plen_70_part_00